MLATLHEQRWDAFVDPLMSQLAAYEKRTCDTLFQLKKTAFAFYRIEPCSQSAIRSQQTQRLLRLHLPLPEREREHANDCDYGL